MSRSAFKTFGLIVAAMLCALVAGAVSGSLAQERLQFPRKQMPAPAARDKILPSHAPPAFVTGARLPAATQGAAYAVDLKVTGGTRPLRFEVREGALPPGLALNAGALRGVPRSGGHFDFVVVVTDADGTSLPIAAITMRSSLR